MKLKAALLILNPAAHNFPGPRRLDKVKEVLAQHACRLEERVTGGPGEATIFAREAAAAGMDAVFVCGGDGTLREAAAGLIGSETALAFLPAGTVNVWAREVGIPLDPLKAALAAVNGQRRLVDVGQADGHIFLLMAGMGLDAQITHRLPLRLKRWTGASAYAVTAAWEALRWRGRGLVIHHQGGETRCRALMVVAANVRNYAGLVQLAPEAQIADGLLDLCVFQGDGLMESVAHLIRVAIGRHLYSEKVIYLQGRRFQLDWEEPTPCHLDGDPIPISPRIIEALPSSLWAIVPAQT